MKCLFPVESPTAAAATTLMTVFITSPLHSRICRRQCRLA